jgi:hypothetical protein
LYTLYTHENGTDAVTTDAVAIPAWFETSNLGFPAQGIDLWTDMLRVEPDFVLTGNLTMEVLTREYSMAPDVESAASTSLAYVVTPTTTGPNFDGKIDMREQGRQIRLKFTSNTQGGFFECGDVLIYPQPGDVRS